MGTAMDIAGLGWKENDIGEIDHRLLRAPAIKLRGVHQGGAGDWVFCIDLRLARPNTGGGLSTTQLHSLEHFLLEGLQRRLGEHFISLGVMGCQTGFYLVLLNEGRYTVVADALARTLAAVISAKTVPYARIDQCGNYRNHDLEQAQRLAAELLAARASWQEVT